MTHDEIKLVLEALERATRYGAGGFDEAKEVLEKALAKQEHEEMVSKARYNRLRDDYNEAIELLRLAALAAKKWEEHVNRCKLQGVDLDHNFAPQQRKPLTDEQYFEIGQRHWVSSHKVAQIHRELDEAAHDIKDEA